MVERALHLMRAALVFGLLSSLTLAAPHPRESFLLDRIDDLSGQVLPALTELRLGEEQVPLRKLELLKEYLKGKSDSPLAAERMAAVDQSLHSAARQSLITVSNQVVQAVSTNGVAPPLLMQQVAYFAKAFSGPPFRLDAAPLRKRIDALSVEYTTRLAAYEAEIQKLLDLSIDERKQDQRILGAVEASRKARERFRDGRSAEARALDEKLRRSLASVLKQRIIEFSFGTRAEEFVAMESLLKAPAIRNMVGTASMAQLNGLLAEYRGYFMIEVTNASKHTVTLSSKNLKKPIQLAPGTTSDYLSIPVARPGRMELTATPDDPAMNAKIEPVDLVPGGSYRLTLKDFGKTELALNIPLPELVPPVSATVTALPDGNPTPYRRGMLLPVGAYQASFTRPDYQPQSLSFTLAKDKPSTISAPAADSWKSGPGLARLSSLETRLATIKPEGPYTGLDKEFPEIALRYPAHQARLNTARKQWARYAEDSLLGDFKRAEFQMARFRDYLYQVRTFHEWSAGKEVARMRRDVKGEFFALSEKPYNQDLDIDLPADVDRIAAQLGDLGDAEALAAIKERLTLWQEYVGTNQLESKSYRDKYKKRFQELGLAHATKGRKEISAEFFYDALVMDVSENSIIDFKAGAIKKSLATLFGSKVLSPPIDPGDEAIKRINAHLAYHATRSKGDSYLSDIALYLNKHKNQKDEAYFNHFDVLLAVNYFYTMNVRGAFGPAAAGKLKGATPTVLNSALSNLSIGISEKLSDHLRKEHRMLSEDPKFQEHVEWNVAILLGVLPDQSPLRTLLEEWAGNTRSRCETILSKVSRLEKAWWSKEPKKWTPVMVVVNESGTQPEYFVSIGPVTLKRGATIPVRTADQITREKGKVTGIRYGDTVAAMHVIKVDRKSSYQVKP